jgi:hypothetical protein
MKSKIINRVRAREAKVLVARAAEANRAYWIAEESRLEKLWDQSFTNRKWWQFWL